MALRRKKANSTATEGSGESELIKMVESGPTGAYEALQLFRSRANRLKNKNDIPGAITTLAKGSGVLLGAGYENAAFELAELFVELLAENNRPITEDIKALISDMEKKFPEKSARRAEFLKSCIKWSVEVGNRDIGDASLHSSLGCALWALGDKTAAYHFACGENPELYNTKIFEKYPDSNQSEARDRALTLGVVNFLALENMRDAFDLHRLFNKSLASRQLSGDSPLLTFIDCLLQVCRRDAAPLFKTLVNSYASAVDFDEAIPTMLMGPIASKYFGIKPKVNPLMSMLQSMMT